MGRVGQSSPALADAAAHLLRSFLDLPLPLLQPHSNPTPIQPRSNYITSNPKGPSYKAQKKKWDEAKAALLEALSKKLEAQLDAADAAEGEEVRLRSFLFVHVCHGQGGGNCWCVCI